MSVLRVEDLVAGYSSADEILKSVNVLVDAGEIVGVIGPNGAGKSTLLKAVAGLIKPSRGRIYLDDRPIAGCEPREISRLGLTFVPQEQNIFPTMSVRENLEMGGFIDPAGTRRRIDMVLQRFSVLAEKRRHAARTLSGGERQMLAMAMALMVQTTVLLLDEPSAGLSPIAAEKLFENIIGINRDGVAIVMVEQNAREALAIAHRAYVLVDGRNSRSGPAAELAADPDIKRIFLGH